MRSLGSTTPPPVGGAPAQPPPDPSLWSPALLAGLAEHTELGSYTGSPLATGAPIGEPDLTNGPWSFATSLVSTDGSALPEPWNGPLLVRLSSEPESLDREATALSYVGRFGFRVPEVLAVLPVLPPRPGRPGEETGLWALVATGPTEVPMGELMQRNMQRYNELLVAFAEEQVKLHELPVGELWRGRVTPYIDIDEQLARINPNEHTEELQWLRDHQPAPVQPVLCHGGYQPLSTFAPDSDRWDQYGGPGRGLIITNWNATVLAEPEYDVALSLVAFSSIAAFATNRAERTALKMVRNTLLNTYRSAYLGIHPLDLDRLRFWEVFHTLRGLARLAGTYWGEGSVFEAQDRGGLPDELGVELGQMIRNLAKD